MLKDNTLLYDREIISERAEKVRQATAKTLKRHGIEQANTDDILLDVFHNTVCQMIILINDLRLVNKIDLCDATGYLRAELEKVAR